MNSLKRNWFIWLLIASLVLHIVLVIALQPWAKTTMAFNRALEEERSRMVQARELARKEEERLRRQQVKLPKENAEALIKRAELRQRDLLRENVEKLRIAREKAIAERDRALTTIQKRKLSDVLPEQIERLRENLRRMVNATHQLEREPQLGEKPTALKRQIEEALAEMTELKKQAEENPDHLPEYKEAALDLAKLAQEQSKQYKEWKEGNGGSLSHRAMGAEHAARELVADALALAEVDINNLNAIPEAHAIADVPEAARPENIASAPAADLYEAAVELEKQVSEADRQARAAELAAAQGTSVENSLGKIETPTTERPDLSEALAFGKAAEAAGAGAESVGDVNAFREAVRTAASETTDMARRATRATSAESTRPAPARTSLTAVDQAMEERSRSTREHRGRVVDMTALQLANEGSGFGGENEGMTGFSSDQSGKGWDMIGGKDQRTVKLDGKAVAANALPGRMLTENSAREGFLYLDTWYIIGPWDNWSRADYAVVHPPEQRIDLDAIYTDGKFAGQKNDPDQLLRWKFVQSDRIAIEPPRPTYSATYYAYTEVYSDATREMLVAVASDDMAKVWINGQIIWTDVGQSSWNLDEGFRKVIFKKGFNTVLVRIENGPAYVGFSVLLCPPGLAEPPDLARLSR